MIDVLQNICAHTFLHTIYVFLNKSSERLLEIGQIAYTFVENVYLYDSCLY